MRILLFSAVAAACFAQTLTVSPDGPLSTLEAARDAARKMQKPVTIQVRGGLYRLTGTLVLTREDSELTFEAAPGQRVILSGGRVIAGWKKSNGPAWSAPAGQPCFRQLFVNGRRAVRARTPNFGYYRVEGASSQDKPFLLRYRGRDIKPAWAGTDAEVVALLAWADLRMPIVRVDDDAKTATLAGDPRPSNKEVDARYWIENTPDGLDSPGEWYLDRTAGTVSYRPLAGEDMTREEVIAPALVQLVRLEGARGVVFRGFEFAYSDWSMGTAGYADTQASVLTAPAAFEAQDSTDCAIEHCTFRQLGGYAIWFGRGAKRNRIVANEIYDAGGGGVKIGETVQRAGEDDRSWENTVADNHIHDLGQVFPPAVGVWVGQSSRAAISHNHIHDLYYTAISVGWTWGYSANQSKSNLIEYNHLHHVGRDVLSDMGGIYTLGEQPGTIIRNNLIHDISAFTYGGWGIYPDEGSSEMLIENNIVYRAKSAGFHQHYGRENQVRNNIFAFNREHQLMRTRAEPHVSFTLAGNIIYFDQGRLLGNNWTGDGFKFDNNVYWDTRGGALRFAGRSWEQWRASGQDAQSVIADPLFVDPSSFDFRLRPDSPALAMGFQPIDMSTVGPRTIPGAPLPAP